MEDRILKEIKELKSVIAQVIGSSELPAKQKFSKEAIAKAAKEFQKLSIERGEWLVESDIHKVIRKAPWRAGKFIIEKFGFNNYFTRGRTLYFNRKDLVALSAELKKRNIDLSRYIELEEDKEKKSSVFVDSGNSSWENVMADDVSPTLDRRIIRKS